MVYVTPDIEEATRYYRDILGFHAMEHTNQTEEALLLEDLGQSYASDQAHTWRLLPYINDQKSFILFPNNALPVSETPAYACSHLIYPI